jgi:hypothetical protein
VLSAGKARAFGVDVPVEQSDDRLDADEQGSPARIPASSAATRPGLDADSPLGEIGVTDSHNVSLVST